MAKNIENFEILLVLELFYNFILQNSCLRAKKLKNDSWKAHWNLVTIKTKMVKNHWNFQISQFHFPKVVFSGFFWWLFLEIQYRSMDDFWSFWLCVGRYTNTTHRAKKFFDRCQNLKTKIWIWKGRTKWTGGLYFSGSKNLLFSNCKNKKKHNIPPKCFNRCFWVKGGFF